MQSVQASSSLSVAESSVSVRRRSSTKISISEQQQIQVVQQQQQLEQVQQVQQQQVQQVQQKQVQQVQQKHVQVQQVQVQQVQQVQQQEVQQKQLKQVQQNQVQVQQVQQQQQSLSVQQSSTTVVQQQTASSIKQQSALAVSIVQQQQLQQQQIESRSVSAASSTSTSASVSRRSSTAVSKQVQPSRHTLRDVLRWFSFDILILYLSFRCAARTTQNVRSIDIVWLLFGWLLIDLPRLVCFFGSRFGWTYLYNTSSSVICSNVFSTPPPSHVGMVPAYLAIDVNVVHTCSARHANLFLVRSCFQFLRFNLNRPVINLYFVFFTQTNKHTTLSPTNVLRASSHIRWRRRPRRKVAVRLLPRR